VSRRAEDATRAGLRSGCVGWCRSSRGTVARVVTVVDRGCSSKSNLDYLRRAGGHWIAGERMRDCNAQAQAALSRQGRYRAVRDNQLVQGLVQDFDDRLRGAAMAWLDDRKQRETPFARYDELAGFQLDGERIALMDRQRGIRKPARLDAALSMRTTFTPPGQEPPYADTEGPDGLLRYKYRGSDPMHHENVALRVAMQQQRPLIWFVAVAPGVYEAVYPVWLVAEERSDLQFVVAVDQGQRLIPPGAQLDVEQKRYVERLTKLRLHQPVFRARVLQAYESACAMCRLRHPSLLDAAHILPDSHPRGMPVVPNGLALCKIHHAAYDQNILGVRPDLAVQVRTDILAEVDGPMLRHGIQEMAGVRLTIPRAAAAQPNPMALDERYQLFLAGS
jgi:putative restriction endonuclease